MPAAVTPLAKLIEAEITLTGPMPVARFMALALGHPEHGYYMRAEPFGRDGDFTTAPEISQMFGELLGLWCADAWLRMGRPDPVLLVELGPGRGVMMVDALRATARVPGFAAARQVHLVESSPRQRRQQQAALAGQDISWHTSLDEVPAGPMLLLANEFFDALPIRQFVRLRDGWHERMIGLAPLGQGLAFTAAPDPLPLDHPMAGSAPEGAVIETSPAAAAQASQIGERLARQGGLALIVDYGHERPQAAATFQAVRGHLRHDPLLAPGDADLTAHVDFSALSAAAGVTSYGPVAQGDLLRALGIVERATALARNATAAQGASIAGALARLTEPKAMGTLFRALALAGTGIGAPAGFAVAA